MRNYITLNGKNSNEINGLLIQELPPISKPQIRTEVEEIDGRDGDIVTKLGFAAYDKEFTVGLYKDFDINAIIAYFNSEGTVVFSNEPDKYYNYQIIDQIDFERLVRYRTATVRMHCQPFKYSNTEGARTLGNKGTASGEGSFITLDNTPEAQFSKIEPKGNATQTTYSGKNLFSGDFAQFDNQGGSGSTYAYFQLPTDGVYTLSLISKNAAQGSNSTFLGFTVTGGNTTVPVRWAWRNANSATGAGQVFSTTNQYENQILHYVSIYTANANTLQWFMNNFEIQLEAGSTRTDYEPYVGGTASPNPDYPQPISVVTGENVVKITGKNLFDKDNVRVGYRFGSSGDYYVETGYNATEFISVKPNATYSTSWSIKQMECVCTYDASQTFVRRISSGTSFTTASNEFYIRADVTDANLATAQIELGSATAYEPYQGQEFEINLGKNLLENTHAKNTTTTNGMSFTVNDDGSITLNGTATALTWFVFHSAQLDLPDGTYTISLQGGTNANIGVYNDKFGNTSLGSSTTKTITDASGNVSIRVASGATASNLTVKPMIERGSTATDYAPYFTPIELAKIGDYQDRIYKDDSKWYIEKQVGKVVFDGTENWTHQGGGAPYTIDMPDFDRNTNEIRAISDNFLGVKYNANWNNYSSLITSNSSSDTVSRFKFRYTAITSLADFKTWLTSHPTTVYYTLATPVDEEITNETLISQLEALYNQAHAYKGRTHVAAIAQGSNAPHIIEAEVQRSSDGNITNNGNIVSKPTLTIYGSGNIGVSLNGYQILEITLGDEEYITIDTAAMEAYKDTLDNLKNRLVNGDYSKFALRPGSNMIEFSGTVSKCVISKYSRWL